MPTPHAAAAPRPSGILTDPWLPAPSQRSVCPRTQRFNSYSTPTRCVAACAIFRTPQHCYRAGTHRETDRSTETQ